MTKNPLLYGVLLLVLAVFVTQCCFTVHQTQQALVLQLGDPLPEIYRPGLHFKLPFIQKVVYFDARVLDYAASSREAFTVDKKTIVLDNYARWRLSDPCSSTAPCVPSPVRRPAWTTWSIRSCGPWWAPTP